MVSPSRRSVRESRGCPDSREEKELVPLDRPADGAAKFVLLVIVLGGKNNCVASKAVFRRNSKALP